MASKSFFFRIAFEVYAGKSNWLKHVCAEGSLFSPYALKRRNK